MICPSCYSEQFHSPTPARLVPAGWKQSLRLIVGIWSVRAGTLNITFYSVYITLQIDVICIRAKVTGNICRERLKYEGFVHNITYLNYNKVYSYPRSYRKRTYEITRSNTHRNLTELDESDLDCCQQQRFDVCVFK